MNGTVEIEQTFERLSLQHLLLVEAPEVLHPSLHIKLSSTKIFVKAMACKGSGYLHLKEKLGYFEIQTW